LGVRRRRSALAFDVHVRRSPFAFTVRPFAVAVRRSPFGVRRSAFALSRSAFAGLRSVLDVHRSRSAFVSGLRSVFDVGAVLSRWR
jgi:hypothetical protein